MIANIFVSRYHGGEKLAQSNELSTTFITGCRNPRWNELLTFPILLVDLPQEVRLNLALYHGKPLSDDQVASKLIGWTNFCFIDENGFLEVKKHVLRLWKDPPFYSCDEDSDPPTPTDEEMGLLDTIVSTSGFLPDGSMFNHFMRCNF